MISGKLPGGDGCSYGFEAPEPKFDPQLSQAFAANPAARRVFVVIVKRVDLTPPPECTGCTSCRSCPERDAALADLKQKVEASQACSIAYIVATGGEALESFWLGNSVLARLTHQQALEVARLTDVQHMSDGDGPATPPP